MYPADHAEHPGLIFCRKCGRSAGYDPSEINNQLDKQTTKMGKFFAQKTLPREQWAEEPILLYQDSKQHCDAFEQRWFHR